MKFETNNMVDYWE